MNSKIYLSENSAFLTTDTRATRWAIPYNADCLNSRIGNLLDRQKDAVEEKKILDIGSHNGTFSYAALLLGAGEGQGVEVEEKTVARCRTLFQGENISESLYRFEVQNIHDFLETVPPNSFDTIFCFGMFYYTPNPLRLLELMNRAVRSTILIDTFTAAYAAVQGKDALNVYPKLKEETLDLPVMFVSLTQSEKKDYRLPHSFEHKGKELSLLTLPTKSLLEIWFQYLNIEYTFLDWSDYTVRTCSYHDLYSPEQKKKSHWADVYASGIRVSYRLDKK